MSFFERLAEIKNYFGLLGSYLGIVNFLLLLATVKQSYSIHVSAYLLVPLGFFGALLIGWIDYRYVAKHQMAHSNRINDQKVQLDRIERKLERIERKLEGKD